MKTFESVRLGVAQGEAVLFSAFEDGGEMWVGDGPRLHREQVSFDDTFMIEPAVYVGVSMIDMSNAANIRMDVTAENVTMSGFEIVFRTWGDSKVARVRVAWQALGPVADEENWDL